MGLVSFCVMLTFFQLRMIFSGKFVPREQVDLIVADLRARIEFLEGASTTKDLTIGEQASQIAKLTAQGDLSVRLLESITAYSTNARSGSGYVAQAE
ncbi:hypothetical protein [Nocardia fusca]|uniref:Uncharacterized protein n=1 Tax=Nocardia fusca TaxID=941183 RepID=A0ABV3FIE8_9NOCA